MYNSPHTNIGPYTRKLMALMGRPIQEMQVMPARPGVGMSAAASAIVIEPKKEENDTIT